MDDDDDILVKRLFERDERAWENWKRRHCPSCCANWPSAICERAHCHQGARAASGWAGSSSLVMLRKTRSEPFASLFS